MNRTPRSYFKPSTQRNPQYPAYRRTEATNDRTGPGSQASTNDRPTP